ncbi:hypothetical protein TNCV_4997381 [Trichonephila clavipes]|nr:hypothetical protein TNCV_4997381 [Trichonephila clavipes]
MDGEPSWHGGTPNSCRAAIPLARLVEGVEWRETPDHPLGVLPENWGGIESNPSVTSDTGHPVSGRNVVLTPNSGIERNLQKKIV